MSYHPKRLIASAMRTKFRRYVTIGFSVFTVEIVVISVAQRMGAGAVLAVGLGYWCGLVFSFVLQKLVAFKDKRMHHKVLLPQLVLYALLILFNFGFTIVMTHLLSAHFSAVFIRTATLGITTLWNFYIYKHHIFVVPENPVY